MRELPESRVERWMRMWHLHRKDVQSWIQAGLFVALVIVFVGAFRSGTRSMINQIEGARWWKAMSSSARNLVLGLTTGLVGALLLWKRPRRISSFLDLRVFVGGIVLLVIALVLLWRAASGL